MRCSEVRGDPLLGFNLPSLTKGQLQAGSKWVGEGAEGRPLGCYRNQPAFPAWALQSVSPSLGCQAHHPPPLSPIGQRCLGTQGRIEEETRQGPSSPSPVTLRGSYSPQNPQSGHSAWVHVPGLYPEHTATPFGCRRCERTEAPRKKSLETRIPS